MKLTEELKRDPEKFCKEGKDYQLLQEYFEGFPIDTLRKLFYEESILIRQVAVWITSELGSDATDLLKEVTEQINNRDTITKCFALQMVAHNAHGIYFDEFIRVFSFLEEQNQIIRLFVMLLIAGLSGPRIDEAYVYLENKKKYNDSHIKGLLSLINVNVSPPSEIEKMIDSDDAIIRKYGIIAAKKVYKKYPHLINEAVDNNDSDIKEFSKNIIDAELAAKNLKIKA